MSPSINGRENREFAAELKFVLARPVAEQVLVWARAHLIPDPHAVSEWVDGYQITSLYFDTPHFDVFHRKGSFGRSKYRIRRYGPSEVAFLERKLKTRGLVSKRRSVVTLDELQRLTTSDPTHDWPGFWYHQRLLVRRLRPICQISYRRAARVAMSAYGPIRLTLDDNIRALPVGDLAFHNGEPSVPISDGQVVLELKYRLEMPALFKQLAEEFALTPQPISKYRLAVTALGFATVAASSPAAAAPADSSVCLNS